MNRQPSSIWLTLQLVGVFLLALVPTGCMVLLKTTHSEPVQISFGAPATPAPRPAGDNCDTDFRAKRMEVPPRPTFTEFQPPDEMLTIMAVYVKNLYLFRERELDYIDAQYHEHALRCKLVGTADLGP